MIAAGVFDDDACRIELIDGLLIEMTPIGPAHSFVVERLNRLLVRTLSDAYSVRPQLPVTLGDKSEPQPDIAVIRAKDSSLKRQPKRALLAIEVADASLDFDRNVKARLYARSGVPEYWIVSEFA
jgi:Uma2 family endonuclease